MKEADTENSTLTPKEGLTTLGIVGIRKGVHLCVIGKEQLTRRGRLERGKRKPKQIASVKEIPYLPTSLDIQARPNANCSPGWLEKGCWSNSLSLVP